MAKNTGAKRYIEYVPPSPDVIDEVARKVCRRLAESDPIFNQSDAVFGFASFLSAVTKMHANRLNTLTSKPKRLDTKK